MRCAQTHLCMQPVLSAAIPLFKFPFIFHLFIFFQCVRNVSLCQVSIAFVIGFVDAGNENFQAAKLFVIR